MAAPFLVARNPDGSSRLPIVVRLPLVDDPAQPALWRGASLDGPDREADGTPRGPDERRRLRRIGIHGARRPSASAATPPPEHEEETCTD